MGTRRTAMGRETETRRESEARETARQVRTPRRTRAQTTGQRGRRPGGGRGTPDGTTRVLSSEYALRCTTLDGRRANLRNPRYRTALGLALFVGRERTINKTLLPLSLSTVYGIRYGPLRSLVTRQSSLGLSVSALARRPLSAKTLLAQPINHRPAAARRVTRTRRATPERPAPDT
jgi:hypothetical protein